MSRTTASSSGKPVRCAIYTRKSSDEGLEQSFNSLDAQRAAGEAYVLSQASEGWTLIPTLYDDGGYSGGTMERRGLKQLLTDIAAGQVDVVVVYKIDRLTRSLTDFSRIIEIFDAANCSFVSVTQSFNTTDSMGRLMLNVLLSFAQFEREVTGERIRDKIAASKAKGMWMGGNLPLGYDLPEAGTRKLRVHEDEAITVRQVFARYLELGSVHALQRELAEQGIVSKLRTYASGRTSGGTPFSRGALFHLLRNRIYLGQIVHKDQVFDGEHKGIVDPDLFARVQQKLDGNARRHRSTADHRMVKAPLTGRLFDAAREPMSPTFSRGKSGRAYRYYVSASLQQGKPPKDTDVVQRISATALERIVGEVASRWLAKPDDALAQVMTVRLTGDGLIIEIKTKDPVAIAAKLLDGERIVHTSKNSSAVLLPLALPLRGGRRTATHGQRRTSNPDPTLIAALRKAHAMLSYESGLPMLTAAPASPYDTAILKLAFLAPQIQRDILEGRQPADLTLQRFKSIKLPLAWSKQHAALRYAPTPITCSVE